MFKPVSNKVAFPQMEESILKVWEERGTFKKSLEKNAGGERYKFYDGPPFATGLPHYGHLLAGTIKDIVPRYQTMRGKYVERRFGWDTHGLPIEALAQDALGVSGAHEIKALGVDKFNEQCRSMVLKYVSEWRKTVTRMGRWVDFDNDYKTMDFGFMESVWWVFKQLWNQGRVYRSHRIMPYSWKLSTPLSNFEAGSNYKDVQDPTVTVRAKALSGASDELKSLLAKEPTVYLLIWTTTPWTLPENLAICAGANIDYVAVRDVTDDARPVYVMAKARLPHIFKKEEQYEVVAEFKGTALKGVEYEPIFPYFADKRAEGAFRVLNDDYVTTDDGVGIVHIAPAYGEDDFRVCREAGMNAFVDPLDESCAFTAAVPEFKGRFCKDCDKDIIKMLKASGKLVHQATIVHSYPFCDRTDTPLIYRAIDAWYVRVEDLHERLAKNNSSVHWTPDYVGEKRFGNWLEEARDWNISRNRFWGSCIPVWVNDDDPSDMICVGSAKELEELSGEKVTDLHKHFIDKVVIKKDGKTYHRTPEVLDCWFESGSMPYAQQHYMGEAAAGGDHGRGTGTPESPSVSDFFPADFIAEGLDQTRGWFYTLMVLGTCLFDKSPYRNVIVNGLVLAEDGKKMSKRLKNYPDPTKMLDTYGADAIRLENLKFSENGVKQLMRDLLIPWWNAYSFFVTYANVDGFAETGDVSPDKMSELRSDNVLDRWIVSSMETLIADVTAAMDVYDLQRSVRPFVKFVRGSHELVHPPLAPPLLEVDERRRQALRLQDASLRARPALEGRGSVHAFHRRGDLQESCRRRRAGFGDARVPVRSGVGASLRLSYGKRRRARPRARAPHGGGADRRSARTPPEGRQRPQGAPAAQRDPHRRSGRQGPRRPHRRRAQRQVGAVRRRRDRALRGQLQGELQDARKEVRPQDEGSRRGDREGRVWRRQTLWAGFGDAGVPVRSCRRHRDHRR